MQDALTRAYARLGAWYLWFVIGVAYGSTLLFTGPAAVFVPARFFGMSLAQYGHMLLVMDAGALLALVGGTVHARTEIRTLRIWLNGNREPADAVAAVYAMQSAARSAVAGAIPGAALTVAAAPVTVRAIVGRETFAGALAVVLGAALTVLYAALLCWFWLQLASRPGLADATRLAPEANRILVASTSLTVRLFLGIVSSLLVAGSMVTPFVARFGAGGGAELRSLAVAAAMAATIGLTLATVVALSVSQPVRDLIRGTRAVREGDFTTQVSVTSMDELGTLAESFNDMVAGLRERQALRDQNAELVDELRGSRERIVATADAERRRLERDLHDGAQQHLVLLALKLGMADRMIDKNPVGAHEINAELKRDLDRALAELRALAHGIYPVLLQSEGLPGALREAIHHAAIPAELDCDGTGRYTPEIEAAVYFCCLEALQNAAKHAGADASARLSIAEQDHTLRFAIADDGRGFDPAIARGSAGLQNMADRLGALGGELTISSGPGEGTTVAGSVPLAE
jgi:signal transduction histidine kinase